MVFLNQKWEKVVSTVESHNAKRAENNLTQIEQNIVIGLRNLQIVSVRSNRKLAFHLV